MKIKENNLKIIKIKKKKKKSPTKQKPSKQKPSKQKLSKQKPSKQKPSKQKPAERRKKENGKLSETSESTIILTNKFNGFMLENSNMSSASKATALRQYLLNSLGATSLLYLYSLVKTYADLIECNYMITSMTPPVYLNFLPFIIYLVSLEREQELKKNDDNENLMLNEAIIEKNRTEFHLIDHDYCSTCRT
jgi:hypothetical protein